MGILLTGGNPPLHPLSPPAQRIVCLSASGLDALMELGLEPIAGLQTGVAVQPEFYGDRVNTWVNAGSWLWPDFKTIRHLAPDLILGWRFPHRFYQRPLRAIAPLYLMAGSGYEAALLRLRYIAQWTDRGPEAEAAIAALDAQIQRYQQHISPHHFKTVIMMGGSRFNIRLNRYPVEADTGTLGSLLSRFTHFPWTKPVQHQGEAGLVYLSLERIAAVNPEIIFVQSYGATSGSSPRLLSQALSHHPLWQGLRAVQSDQVYEVDQFWHWGNGTRLLKLMLGRLLPLIYPHSFPVSMNAQFPT
ncbi:ABC transporter substrate-binding protein [Leptolyngbya sp. PCC 6406]|uniref:ABC transporter substrate-binding protein n=1 Tax=Leptolyngbya sp. PCC 6406 TaxID=1173264 RepID=UPI0002AC1BEE|nr:ABC transporter substrate-binding protein [Leptolyngbya sp. PCC 6406]